MCVYIYNYVHMLLVVFFGHVCYPFTFSFSKTVRILHQNVCDLRRSQVITKTQATKPWYFLPFCTFRTFCLSRFKKTWDLSSPQFLDFIIQVPNCNAFLVNFCDWVCGSWCQRHSAWRVSSIHPWGKFAIKHYGPRLQPPKTGDPKHIDIAEAVFSH